MATFVLFYYYDPDDEKPREKWQGAFGPFESKDEIKSYLRDHGYEYVDGNNSPYYTLWRCTCRPNNWAKVAYELTPPEQLEKGSYPPS